ncbi:methyl-accepting chemotaxis protein [Methanofollis fontis]|uniref:methyl-accepting chemotaxis protein n=1 Tax=Methanofollis fontis TaxID=2052832 RepID=UPI0013EE8D23|nr:methyl-accepting chemotaxis protein [Methanofollis fontis]
METQGVVDQINQATATLSMVADAIRAISQGTLDGNLDIRADATAVPGVWSDLIGDCNLTLETVAAPLRVVSAHLGQIVDGEMTGPITGEYAGEYAIVTGNLNRCLMLISDMQHEVEGLNDAVSAGQMHARIDGSRFSGSWGRMAEEINALLDACTVPLSETAAVLDAYCARAYSVRFSDDIVVTGDFQRLKESVNAVGIQVSQTVAEMKDIMQEIRCNTETVSRGSHEIERASENVAITTQEATGRTQQLYEKIEDINRQIGELSSSTMNIEKKSSEVLESAMNVVNFGKEAQIAGDDANTKMAKVEEIARRSVEEIHALTEQVQRVSSVVKIINEIARQINLLALNAAIEAARAGVHGRGFAVVAGEVKKLAGEAREATEKIENVVSNVQESSGKTAEAITAANAEIVEGVASVNAALLGLNKIIQSAEQVREDICAITSSIEDQAEIAFSVVSNVSEGAEMTMSFQKQMEDLAALAQETSASVVEIGKTLHESSALVSVLDQGLEGDVV